MNNMILIKGLPGALDSFYLCDHPTTEREFLEIITSVRQENKSEKPVVNVSVLDALLYCNALSKREGLAPYYNITGTNVSVFADSNGYRLPTAEEWIYASRELMDFDNIHDYAWFQEAYVKKELHPVCQKKPSPSGLYDMYGNVWEWSYTPDDNSFNDHGGCYKNKAKNIKHQYCGGHKASGLFTKQENIGFRVARNIPCVKPKEHQRIIIEKRGFNMHKYDVFFNYSNNLTLNFANPIPPSDLKYFDKTVLASLSGCSALTYEDWHNFQSDIFAAFYCESGISFKEMSDKLLARLSRLENICANTNGIVFFCGLNDLTVSDCTAFLNKVMKIKGIKNLRFVHSDKHFDNESFISLLLQKNHE